jgi:hypothetical protein
VVDTAFRSRSSCKHRDVATPGGTSFFFFVIVLDTHKVSSRITVPIRIFSFLTPTCNMAMQDEKVYNTGLPWLVSS